MPTKPLDQQDEDFEEVEFEDEEESPSPPPKPEPGDDDSDEDTDEEEEVGGDDEDLKEYSQSVPKRIGKLTAKLREAERREKAATEYASSVQKNYTQAQEKLTSLDTSYVTEFENRLTVQKKLASQKLREAIDRGDADQQVEAQNEIAKLATEEARLETVKAKQATAKARAEAGEDRGDEDLGEDGRPKPHPVQRPPPHPKAVAWAGRNKWFGQDEAMTLTAYSEHRKLVEDEGFDAVSDEYYQELDRRMRTTFPHKFKKAAPVEEEEVDDHKPTPQGRPRVAGQQRPSQQKPGGKKTIKLSPSEVAIARKLNVPLAEYAKQVARMRQQES